ncbi:hypothetical protein FF38_07462 [Lucilia cuprina]|uniref:Uncharacterized protein n=1 Tax=Lucilia cuprina TaxID=7375 RepID=A0A0L0CDG2_LUCCU|nr:hypothetical protein FF38_07462 [Lucilia cuprina]
MAAVASPTNCWLSRSNAAYLSDTDQASGCWNVSTSEAISGSGSGSSKTNFSGIASATKESLILAEYSSSSIYSSSSSSGKASTASLTKCLNEEDSFNSAIDLVLIVGTLSTALRNGKNTSPNVGAILKRLKGSNDSSSGILSMAERTKADHSVFTLIKKNKDPKMELKNFVQKKCEEYLTNCQFRSKYFIPYKSTLIHQFLLLNICFEWDSVCDLQSMAALAIIRFDIKSSRKEERLNLNKDNVNIS